MLSRRELRLVWEVVTRKPGNMALAVLYAATVIALASALASLALGI